MLLFKKKQQTQTKHEDLIIVDTTVVTNYFQSGPLMDSYKQFKMLPNSSHSSQRLNIQCAFLYRLQKGSKISPKNRIMTTLDTKADCNMQRINALLYFARFFLVFKKTRLDCIKKKKSTIHLKRKSIYQ